LAPPEVLTYGPRSQRQEQWIQRTVSQSGTQLAQIRDRILAMTQFQRHHRVLDLLANHGLMLWELVRQVPEGASMAE
ncbi:MAG: AAA family ATPase, partial [Acaryochloridaceae cyanobacterium RL_2_7]|nr:AAA family ATPase [Acaryochloridaceae cyanobacterium RL_2_7]